ncbi:MAG: dihydrolipoamide acetyltransferase family protein [Flavobacteriaceae bacterium]
MAKIEIRLPEMGESVAEATITNWIKSVGDRVEEDEVIVEVATDKVDSEVVSEYAGILIEQRFAIDEVAEVGTVIAIIETEGGSDSSVETESTPVQNPSETEPIKESEESVREEPTPAVIEAVESPIANHFSKPITTSGLLSPLVRNMAKEEGVSDEELSQIQGTGLDGRVTKYDMMAYLEKRGGSLSVSAAPSEITTPVKESKPIAPSAPVKPASIPTAVPASGDEIIELNRMAKLTADHMIGSLQTSAHVQSFIEVDMTKVVEWRAAIKDQFERTHGEKLTFTPIFFEVVAKALKAFPMLNIQFDGEKIIKKASVNLGMATALEDGNLIVPVIKDADTLNLVGLAKKVNDLAARARKSALKPDEVMQGTYTITNIGSFGSVMGTPIIPQPQVAILAIGAIRKVPAVVDTDQGEFIAIRHKMFLSHSYDHRVVNGALGGLFIKHVADLLENWSMDRKV